VVCEVVEGEGGKIKEDEMEQIGDIAGEL